MTVIDGLCISIGITCLLIIYLYHRKVKHLELQLSYSTKARETIKATLEIRNEEGDRKSTIIHSQRALINDLAKGLSKMPVLLFNDSIYRTYVVKNGQIGVVTAATLLEKPNSKPTNRSKAKQGTLYVHYGSNKVIELLKLKTIVNINNNKNITKEYLDNLSVNINTLFIENAI